MTDSIQSLPAGFGSYLDGILPPDQAITAGAFAQSMMQVKNIQKVDPVRFGQIVYSIETTANLPLVNGTNVPTDVSLATAGHDKLALGSGLYGSYTISDFFGCMTGLPYPLKDIQNGIVQLQSPALIQTYIDLYLAVKQVTPVTAILTPITTEVAPGNWQLTELTITNAGAGYGRGGAPAPVITLNNGAVATCTIGKDYKDLTTLGKIVSISITNSGSSGADNFTASVGPPPVVPPGSLDAIVQGYITQANTEILAISTATPSNVEAANILNTNWNITGTALKIEQRTRYNLLSPVPIPRDNKLNPFPGSIITFVDAIPSMSQDTLPHMGAQTLEALSDPCLVGGQSLIGMMRQERNQLRLQEIGVPIDNNIPGIPTIQQQQILLTSGTIQGAVDGVSTPSGNFTLPAWNETQRCDETKISPIPIAFYDPTTDDLLIAGETALGNTSSLFTNSTGNTSSLFTNSTPLVSTIVPVGPGTPLNPGNILPPNLNIAYTSSTLAPSTYDDQEAVEKVIECNCDCWID